MDDATAFMFCKRFFDKFDSSSKMMLAQLFFQIVSRTESNWLPRQAFLKWARYYVSLSIPKFHQKNFIGTSVRTNRMSQAILLSQ